MKRLLIALSIVLFMVPKVFSAPSNSMSITVPVDATVISASDETSRYNEITSKFNAHDHTDISQTSNDFTLNGPTPTITLGDGTAEDTTILYDGNAQDYYIALDDSEDDLVIGRGSTVGTTPRMSITDGDTDPNIVLNNATNGPHMRLTGDPTVSSPTDGDFWYTGSALNFRDGLTTINLFSPVIVSPLTIGDGSAADVQINFDGNEQDWHVGLEDDTNDFSIGLGTTLGTTTHIIIDEDGRVLKPLQPAFQAFSAGQADIGDNVTVTFATERFDIGSNFATNTFTAPITGKYILTINVSLTDTDSAATDNSMQIITSNKSYLYIWESDTMLVADGKISAVMSVVADMDASDTAHVQHRQTGGIAQGDISTDSGFSGALIN